MFRVDSADNIYMSFYRNGAFFISNTGKVKQETRENYNEIKIKDEKLVYFVQKCRSKYNNSRQINTSLTKKNFF